MKRLLHGDGTDECRRRVHGRALRTLKLDESGVLLEPAEGEHVLEAHSRPLRVAHGSVPPLDARHMRREQRAAVPRALQHRLHGDLGHALQIGQGKGQLLLQQAVHFQPPLRDVDLRQVEVVAQVEPLDRGDPRGDRRAHRLVVGRPFRHADEVRPPLGMRESRNLHPAGEGGGTGQRRFQELPAIQRHGWPRLPAEVV